MIISNTQEIPGKTIVEFFGVVSGSTVRAKHIGRDIMASLKNVIGGELTGYTELLSEARGEAMRRMSYQGTATLSRTKSYHGSPKLDRSISSMNF